MRNNNWSNYKGKLSYNPKVKMPNRIPVMYKGRHLMPMKRSRAVRLVKAKKAIWVKDWKLGVVWLKLKYDPSGDDLQEYKISLGYDTGSVFESATVNGGDFNQSFQISMQTNRAKKNKICKRVTKRSEIRRIRRSRLHGRKSAQKTQKNRPKEKYSKTIEYKLAREYNLLSKLFKYYPIGKCCIENVRYNHYKYKNGSTFSACEIGKTKLFEMLLKFNNNLDLTKVSGWFTKVLRKKYFNRDQKVKGIRNKGKESWYTHSLDSYSLSRYPIEDNIRSNKNVFRFTNIIVQENWITRRELHQEKSLYTSRSRPQGGSYFRYGKGGKIIPFVKWSKLKTVKIKPLDQISNSGPWNYTQPKQIECIHKFRKAYGGQKNYTYRTRFYVVGK